MYVFFLPHYSTKRFTIGLFLLVKSSDEGLLEELKQYTRRLVASLPPPVNGIGIEGSKHSQAAEEKAEGSPSTFSNGTAVVDAGLRLSMDEAREQEEEEDQAIVGCREAVEILTRLPKKGKHMPLHETQKKS